MASSRTLLLAADSITVHLAAVVAIWASPDIESMSAPVNVCASFVRACISKRLLLCYLGIAIFFKSAVKIVRRARRDL